MTNQMIGVSSVFVVTLFLFVLRYCLLMLGRARRDGYDTPTLQGAIIESDVKPVENMRGSRGGQMMGREVARRSSPVELRASHVSRTKALD